MNYIQLLINEPNYDICRPCTDFIFQGVFGFGALEEFELEAEGVFNGKPYWEWVRSGGTTQFLAWDGVNAWELRDGASVPGSTLRAVFYPSDITSSCPPISVAFQQAQNSAVKDTWQSTAFLSIGTFDYEPCDIGVGELDLKNEFDIALQYSIADIKDISKRNAAYSKTMILPGTKRNNYWFGNLFDVNSDFTLFNPNKKTVAKLLVNTEIVINGFLQLRKIIKSNVTDNGGNEINYEVVIYNNAVDMFSVLGEKTINILDLGQFGHTFSRDNIVASWDNTYEEGYVYPMFGTHIKDNQYKPEYFYPAIYYRTLVDQMIREAGFGWTGSLLENEQFNKEVISYVTDGRPKLDEVERERRKFFVGRTASFTARAPVSFNGAQPDGRFVNDFLAPFPGFVPQSGTNSRMNDETTSPFFDNDVNFNTSVFEWELDRNGRFECEGSVRVTLNFENLSTTQNSFAFFAELDENGIVPGTNPIAATSGNPPLFSLIAAVQVFDAGTGTFNGTNSTWTTTTIDVAMPVFILANSTNGTTADINFKGPVRDLKFGDRVRVAIMADRSSQNIGVVAYSQLTDVSMITRGDIVNGQRVTKFYNIPVVSELTQNEFIDLAAYLPDKIKQKDLLGDLIRRYNLFIQTNPENEKQLIFDTRTEFYEYGLTKDWTQKKDYSSPDEIELLSDLQTKMMIWSYKSDTSDIYNKEYGETTGDIYGQFKYTFDNDFVKGESRIESSFSPTPLVKTPFGAIVPGINPELPKVQPRIFLWGGLRDCEGWNWRYQIPFQFIDEEESFTQYPYAGHFDDPIQPNIDINFGTNKYLYYNDWEFVTDNNMFNTYWEDYIRQIETGRLITSFFYLDEGDINYIKDNFNTKIFVLDSYYFVNKIIDYKPLTNGVTKVELLKIVDGVRYEPKKTRLPVIERPDGKPFYEASDLSVGSGNSTPGGGVVVGNNNVAGGKRGGVYRGLTAYSGFNNNLIVGNDNVVIAKNGMSIGDGNIILSDKSAVLGGDNNFIDTGASNVVLIGASNITATESNVIYIGNNFSIDAMSGNFLVGTVSQKLEFYKEEFSPPQASITLTASGTTNSIVIDNNVTEIGYVNDSDGWFINFSIDGTSPVLNLRTGFNDGNVVSNVGIDAGSITSYAGPVSVNGTFSSVLQQPTQWRSGQTVNNILVSELRTYDGGIILNVPGTGSEIYIQNIATSSVGLSTGALFTQTSAQLGGTGSTKVLCIA